MLDVLLALTLFASSAPKLIYKPDPARSADVATVELITPRRNSCFGVVRVSMLLSSRKTDRNRAYVLAVTVADSPALAVITEGRLGGAAMKLLNLRNGDVACTEYQCPTGSAAVFEVTDTQRQALLSAGALPLAVATTGGADCKVEMPIDKAVVEALDAWADKLPKAG